VSDVKVAKEKRRDYPIVLCRYDLADMNEPKKFCGKSVEKGSIYCPVHKKRYPFWP
jgi:hypothetical protein